MRSWTDGCQHLKLHRNGNHNSCHVFVFPPINPSAAFLVCVVSVADVSALAKELDEFELKKIEARAVTGVLASHPNSTDVHISSLSLTFHGQELLSDTSLELNSGRRYGLIGLNGTGVDYSLVRR